MERTFLGVDPGTTTGLAVLRTTHNGWVAAHDQVRGIHDARDWIRAFAEDQPCTMVYESFYLGARTLKASKSGVWDALNLVGWIAVECEDWLQCRVFAQSPAEGKTVKDDVLKGMGLYNPSMVHGTDAMRHLVRHHLNYVRGGAVSKKYVDAVNNI